MNFSGPSIVFKLNRAIECPEFDKVCRVHVGETEGFVPIRPAPDRTEGSASMSRYPHADRWHFKDAFLSELRDRMEAHADEPHLMPPIRSMIYLNLKLKFI